jgi:ABC-type glycerol-3-phosphate transport system permease component
MAFGRTAVDPDSTLGYRIQRQLSRSVIYVFLIFGALAMILPFVWMVSTSLKSEREVLSFPPTWIPHGKYVEVQGELREIEVVRENFVDGTVDVRVIGHEETLTIRPEQAVEKVRFRARNYPRAWNEAPFGRYYFNTIFMALTVMIGVLITSSLAAYAFARMKFWGRDFIFITFLSMMMVPPPVYIVPSYIILDRLGWIDTYAALIVPWLAHAFSIFLLRQHFKTIPDDLYDAAIIDGCSRLGFLIRIVLPLSKAVLVTVALFTIIANWNSFLWPLVMTNSPEVRPLQVGLATFSQEQGTRHEMMMAAATFCIAPLLVLYFFAQKRIIASHATSGLKG